MDYIMAQNTIYSILYNFCIAVFIAVFFSTFYIASCHSFIDIKKEASYVAGFSRMLAS